MFLSQMVHSKIQNAEKLMEYNYYVTKTIIGIPD